VTFDRAPLRDRVEWFAVFGLLDVANHLFATIRTSWHDFGPEGALVNIGGISAIILFAIYVIAAIGLKESDTDPGKPLDRLVLAGMAIAAFLPLAICASLALLASGLYLFLTSQPLTRSRQIGMMFLALTATMLWWKLPLEIMPKPFLDLDASLAGHLAGTRVSGNVIYNRGTSGGVVVFDGCSSLHNMSLAIVLWASLICVFDLRPTGARVLSGAIAVVAMAAINIIRLATMAYFPSDFEYLHTGFGGTIFSMASLIAAGSIIGYGFVLAEKN